LFLADGGTDVKKLIVAFRKSADRLGIYIIWFFFKFLWQRAPPVIVALIAGRA